MAGAAVTGSGEVYLSGSAESTGATSTNSLLNAAQGGDTYNESNISSGYKTDTSLTEINQLFNINQNRFNSNLIKKFPRIFKKKF